MGKKKKKKKRPSLIHSLQPFISDDRVIHALFDAAAAGVAWVAARQARQDANKVKEVAQATERKQGKVAS